MKNIALNYKVASWAGLQSRQHACGSKRE